MFYTLRILIYIENKLNDLRLEIKMECGMYLKKI